MLVVASFFWTAARAAGTRDAAVPGRPPELERARAALDEGIPAVAAPLLRDLLRGGVEPATKIEATLLLARALVGSGDGEAALDVLDGMAMPGGETHLLRGEALMLLGRWDEAAAAFAAAEDAGDIPPDDISLRRAAALLRGGQPAQALDLAQPLLVGGDERRNAHASLTAAEALLALDRPAEAVAVIEAMEDAGETPLELRRQYLLGRGRLALGEASQALDVLLPPASDAFGTPAGVHAGAGLAAAEAHLALDQPQEAGDVVTQFIDKFPDSPWLRDYFVMLGRIVRERENYSTRQLRLWVMDEAHPVRSQFSRYFLARALVLEGDASQAMSFLNPLLAADTPEPLRTDAIIEAAGITAETNPAEAVALLDREMKSVARAEDKARLSFAAAGVLRAGGDHAAAAEHFAQAAASPALAESAAYNRAVSLIAARDEQGFLAAYRDFSARFPESPLRSDLVLEEGLMQAAYDAEKAASMLDVFLRDFPGHPRAAEAQIALARLALAKSPPDLDAARLLLATVRQSPVSNALRADADFLEVQLAKADPRTPPAAMIAAAGAFLEVHPEGVRADDARMILAETHFRSGDYARAQIEFERLAEAAASVSTAETAWFLAADSAVRTLNPETLDRAVELYESAASLGGPLKPASRIGQARVKFRQGAHDEAVVIYDNVLADNTDPATRLDAMLGKAEALMAGGRGETPPDTAVALLRDIADSPDASPSLRNQALWKAGRALEQAGRHDEALTTYFEAFAESPKAGETLDFFWHDKAAFDAGRLLESRQQWQSAVGIYRKLAALPGPRADEARLRLDRLRLEHFLWDE